MYSVKPGRGPSLIGGISGVAVAIFGVIWTFAVSSTGAPGFFYIIGIVFIVIAINIAIYNFLNAGKKNRMSYLDITTDHEESDPIAQALGYGSYKTGGEKRENSGPIPMMKKFCPYCGTALNSDFNYCPKCGKSI